LQDCQRSQIVFFNVTVSRCDSRPLCLPRAHAHTRALVSSEPPLPSPSVGPPALVPVLLSSGSQIRFDSPSILSRDDSLTALVFHTSRMSPYMQLRLNEQGRAIRLDMICLSSSWLGPRASVSHVIEVGCCVTRKDASKVSDTRRSARSRATPQQVRARRRNADVLHRGARIGGTGAAVVVWSRSPADPAGIDALDRSSLQQRTMDRLRTMNHSIPGR
jgi:hypothetical protein